MQKCLCSTVGLRHVFQFNSIQLPTAGYISLLVKMVANTHKLMNRASKNFYVNRNNKKQFEYDLKFSDPKFLVWAIFCIFVQLTSRTKKQASLLDKFVIVRHLWAVVETELQKLNFVNSIPILNWVQHFQMFFFLKFSSRFALL